MFGVNKQRLAQLEAENRQLNDCIRAINRSMATIEFDLQGNILNANENFLKVMGYSLDEVKGKHHSLFVEQNYKDSDEYRHFWQRLNAGEFFSDRYMRIGKGGKIIWIEATYNPLMDSDGKPYRVVKFASDVTARVMHQLESEAKLKAIDSSYAVIEFETDGTIIEANSNFCGVLEYQHDEIIGKHHRIFVDQAFANTDDYKKFWQELAAGVEKVYVFRRISKTGKDVWIQAAYIPISMAGKPPHKVIKIAADITEQKQHELDLARMVDEAGKVLQAMSEGDLTLNVLGDYSGKLHDLKTDLNSGVNKLCSALSEINFAVVSVSDSANEVATSSAALAERTQENAQSLEQANSMMTSSQEQFTQPHLKVNDADDKTKQQLGIIDSGGSLMNQTLSAMEEIKNSSEQITNIVALIDGIAFQTNLLALNAAVEAARAGEHGRGFAVVAGEVRNLAQKSAEAAKDIKTLIEKAVHQSQTGVEVVGRLSENLEDIRDKSNEVADIVAAVGDLASEQTSGMQKIANEIDTIDSATQENAAFVEESSATAENLAQKSHEVLDILKHFKTQN